jgi:predicted HTH domain antitoxin
MVELTVQLPESALAALRKDPGEFANEMLIAAAVKWYELGIVSQEKAAEIAGLSRADFISALNRLHVSPLQYSPEELREELRDADYREVINAFPLFDLKNDDIDPKSGPKLNIDSTISVTWLGLNPN